MNPKNNLDQWAAQWAMHQALTAHPAPEPLIPPQLSSSDPGFFTVSTGINASTLLLRQLDAAIAPDDRQRALDSSLHLVGTGTTDIEVKIQRGEIRHMNPDLKPAWPRAVFVLVLNVDEMRKRALVIPFGPFTAPAFESELATGIGDESLSVLCVWNTHWVSKDLVGRSWVVQVAEAELLSDIDTLRQTLVNKLPLPPELQSRTGDSLLDPTDPRNEYISQEENLFDDLNEE
jgi:hypothetical protein